MYCSRTITLPAGIQAVSVLSLIVLLGCGSDAKETRGEKGPVPVEVAQVEVGRIELRRQLSGSLQPSADFYAASRTSGQVQELRVRVSDPVQRGGVVAVLDDADLVQQVRQAEAEVLVAKANLSEAEARMEIAAKESERAQQLKGRGISSEAQVDTARAEELSAEAGLAVANAQIARAEAALQSARIELDETMVRANWTGGDGDRIVAERLVDEGDVVSANQPMFRIVDLSPLLGIVRVTERDYPRINPGDPVTIATDAYPGEVFSGTITRIAPVFSEQSRQARVEFEVENPDYRLKPGMFVRTSLVLEVKEEATIIPDGAIVRRNDENGIFLLGADRQTVSWHPVVIGIREGERVEVTSAEGVSGEVITVGQQLLNDGSKVHLAESEDVETSQ